MTPRRQGTLQKQAGYLFYKPFGAKSGSRPITAQLITCDIINIKQADKSYCVHIHKESQKAQRKTYKIF